MRALPATVLAIAALCVADGEARPVSAHTPELPRKTPNSTYPAITGRSLPVHAADDLQAAIESARCGDELVLDAGTTWRGNFTLPNKNCSGSLSGGWVIIRSSAKSALPPPGVRATAAIVSHLATLCSANTNPVIANLAKSAPLARAASFYWFEGIDITACPGYRTTLYNAVLFFMPTGVPRVPEDAAVDGMPHDMVFSHCYIHGLRNRDGMVRGLFLNGYNYAVMDSTIADWQSTVQDSQGILMDCGTGSLLIRNNDIEASANSVLIGAPECDLVPADITITHNFFTKQASWNPRFILKNFVEFKNGRRILVDRNVMAHGFAAAQNGTGVVITPRTSTGSEPAGSWASVAQVSDVTITHNVIYDTGLGMVVVSQDTYCTPAMHCVPSARTLIRNNLLYNLNLPGAPNWCFQLDAPNDLTIDHNTCISSNAYTQSLFVDAYPNTNTTLTNNIFSQDIGGQGVVGPAAIALDSKFGTNTGAVIEGNGGFAPGWSAATVAEWDACKCAKNTLFSPGNPFSNLSTFPAAREGPFSRAAPGHQDLGWSPDARDIENIETGRDRPPAGHTTGNDKLNP